MDGDDQRGGSATLAALIDDYGDFIAADLQETYNVDLRDLFRPGSGLTPGWVLLLIANLPFGSRFIAQRRGGQQFRGWDESRYALVGVVNAVRALQYTYVAAHSKSKPKPPDPFPTPDRFVRKQRSNSFALMAQAQMARARKAVEDAGG